MGTKPTLPSVAQGLFEPEPGKVIELVSHQWFDWLESNQSFRYCPMSDDAPYTARKERNGFWYGYRKVKGKLHKRYIGKSEDLLIARLEEVGRLLNATPEPRSIDPDEEVEALRQQMAGLQRKLQVAELQRKLKEAKEQCDRLVEERDNLKAQCESLTGELESVRQDRDDYATALDEFNKNRKQRQAKALTTEKRDRILAALRVGSQSPQYKRVKAVLDQMLMECKND